MYIKKNPRVTFKSNRRPNFKRNNNFSSNKSRNKGNVTQQYNKYLKMAKEAFSSGDRVQSEYYYQFTDHYYRLMIEMGISLEEDDSNENKIIETSIENNNENNSSLDEKKNEEENVSSIEVDGENNNDDDDLESIESIPFISKPVKKKVTKRKKASI